MNRTLRVLLGATIALAVVAVATGSLLADEPDSAFHDVSGAFVDDGMQIERAAADPTALRNEPGVADLALVVLEATRPYTGGELDAYDDLVRAGATLVVLDTHGNGTQITSRHGVAFERVRLDEPGSIRVTLDDNALHTSAANATALLVRDPRVEVLGSSTPDSHLDRDGKGIIDAADPNGPFPVVARIPLGDGVIWAIAAPAAFDPAEDHDLDEEAFRALVLGDARRIVIDESHVVTDDPLLAAARTVALLGGDPWRWMLPAAAGLAFVAATLPVTVPGLRPHRFDARTLLTRDHAVRQARTGTGSGLTARGRIALATCAGALVAGISFASTQASWAAATLLVPSLAALFVGPPRATAVRTVSTKRTGEGMPVTVDLRVQFKGSRAGVVVQDELPGFFDAEPAPVVHPQRRTMELTYTVRPARLGRYDIGPLHAERSDPLGMHVQVSDLLESTDIRVTPRLEGTRDAPFKTKVPQIISGGHQVNRAGSGSEFLALREYQVGDTMRMVNWKASARAKNLMVNQRVHETPMVLTLIVDARAVSDWGPADSTPFVRAARSAASVAQETIAGRDKCQIVLYGDGVQRIDGRGADVLHRFQEHMADTRAAGDTPLDRVVEELKADLKSGQPVVFVGAGEDDPTLPDALEKLRRRGSPVHVVMPMMEDLGDAATRAASRQQRDLSARLRARGFPVYELEAGRPLEDSWRIMEAAA